MFEERTGNINLWHQSVASAMITKPKYRQQQKPCTLIPRLRCNRYTSLPLKVDSFVLAVRKERRCVLTTWLALLSAKGK